MTKTRLPALTHIWIIALVSLLGCITLPSSAHATQTFTNPFGNASTNIYIGRVGASGFQWLMWERKSDGQCHFDQIGGSVGLFDDTLVFAGDGHDDIEVWGNTGSRNGCGFGGGQIDYNGHFLDVVAEGGNDDVFVNTDGDTWLFGGSGADDLWATLYAGARVFGGSGSDVIWSSATRHVDRLFGEEYADTFCMIHDDKPALLDGGTSLDCREGPADKIVSVEFSGTCNLCSGF